MRKGVDICCVCHRRHGVCMKVMLNSDTIFHFYSFLNQLAFGIKISNFLAMFTCAIRSVVMAIA